LEGVFSIKRSRLEEKGDLSPPPFSKRCGVEVSGEHIDRSTTPPLAINALPDFDKLIFPPY
jgi:hypothetical protein